MSKENKQTSLQFHPQENKCSFVIAAWPSGQLKIGNPELAFKKNPTCGFCNLAMALQPLPRSSNEWKVFSHHICQLLPFLAAWHSPRKTVWGRRGSYEHPHLCPEKWGQAAVASLSSSAGSCRCCPRLNEGQNISPGLDCASGRWIRSRWGTGQVEVMLLIKMQKEKAGEEALLAVIRSPSLAGAGS